MVAPLFNGAAEVGDIPTKVNKTLRNSLPVNSGSARATAEVEDEDDYDQRAEFYPLIECGNFANLLSATKARSSSAGGSSGGVGSEKERVSIRNFSYFSR